MSGLCSTSLPWLTRSAHRHHLANPTRHQCCSEGLARPAPESIAEADLFAKDICPRCKYPELISAIPNALRELLLLIVRPKQREDGSTHIVTAREAAEIMNTVIES